MTPTPIYPVPVALVGKDICVCAAIVQALVNLNYQM